MSRRETKVLWLVAGVTLVWAVVMLVLSSDGMTLVEHVGYVTTAIAFAVLTVATGVFVIGFRRHRPHRRLPMVLLTVQVVCLVAAFAGVSLRLAFDVRLMGSRHALESTARQVLAGKAVDTPRWIGWFKVSEVYAKDGDVRFVVGDSGASGATGVIYSPLDDPTYVSMDSDYWHVQGPWWGWQRGFRK
jgi:hypothetical protein